MCYKLTFDVETNSLFSKGICGSYKIQVWILITKSIVLIILYRNRFPES